jgi:hypothetical protein
MSVDEALYNAGYNAGYDAGFAKAHREYNVGYDAGFARAKSEAQDEAVRLREALTDLVQECEEYARINHLHNDDGSPATTGAMKHAYAALAKEGQ